MRISDFPKFAEFIKQLGKTDRERADALGMTERNFQNWKKKSLPRSVIAFKPDALRALADDIETNQAA
jgi:hypothetical protein